MDQLELGVVCIVAFAAVFMLLSTLAVVMRLITAAFPALTQCLDPAVVAAVSTTVATVWPGARLTKIEEER